MKHVLRGLAVALTMLGTVAIGAHPAAAATGSWTINQGHWAIYSDGDFATMRFTKPQTQVPSGTSITNTEVTVTPYGNGNTLEVVKVCYQQQFTMVDYLCTGDTVISGTTNLPTSLFNGLSARGTITVRHTIHGGTYPATGAGEQDTVKVSYQY